MIDTFLRCWFKVLFLTLCCVLGVAFLFACGSVLAEFLQFMLSNPMQFWIGIAAVISVVSVIYVLRDHPKGPDDWKYRSNP